MTPDVTPHEEALGFVRPLLTGEGVAPIAGLSDLRAFVGAAGGDTVVQAALGGRGAASVGWAFACGYQAALRRLGPVAAPAAPGGRLAALCASEEGSAHPSAVRTTLTAGPAGDWELTGDKSFVTLGADADQLLVVAVVAPTGPDDGGRPRLRVACVPASRAGISLEVGAPLPFAPEIAHARVALRGVRVADAELLPGDGYAGVVKPFRTLEDIHVLSAVLGLGLGVARSSGWSDGWAMRAVASVVALQAVGRASPSAPETHVALAGAMAEARALLDGAAWDRAPAAIREAWMRDRPLLDVAQRVRAARLESALRVLGALGSVGSAGSSGSDDATGR